MTNLFVLDLDGCLTEPFKTPDWKQVTRIRELNLQSRDHSEIPPLSICTGRPLPYAEAVAQWLDVRLPFVFESAALFDLSSNRIRTAMDSDSEGDRQQLDSIRRFKNWIREQIVPQYPGLMLEFYKMMDAGIVSADPDQIDGAYEQVRLQIRDHFPELEVHRTEVSVNTLISGNNKGAGIELLSRETGIPLDQIAYIGDSSGDIPALKKVGTAFAPENAIDQTKEVAEVLPFQTSEAVLNAYLMLIERNKAE